MHVTVCLQSARSGLTVQSSQWTKLTWSRAGRRFVCTICYKKSVLRGMGIKYGRGWGGARISLSRGFVLSREHFPSSWTNRPSFTFTSQSQELNENTYIPYAEFLLPAGVRHSITPSTFPLVEPIDLHLHLPRSHKNYTKTPIYLTRNFYFPQSWGIRFLQLLVLLKWRQCFIRISSKI